MLTRSHVRDIIWLMDSCGSQFWSLFTKVRAADEVFIASCLAIVGHIPPGDENSCPDRILQRRVTYVDWPDHESSPTTFYELRAGLLSEVLRQGHLLFRKLKLRNPDSEEERARLARQWVEFVSEHDKCGIAADDLEIEKVVHESVTRISPPQDRGSRRRNEGQSASQQCGDEQFGVQKFNSSGKAKRGYDDDSYRPSEGGDGKSRQQGDIQSEGRPQNFKAARYH
jgi:hypothetical protein